MADVLAIPKRKKKDQRRRIFVCWGGSQHNQCSAYVVAKPSDCGLIGENSDLLSILTENGECVNFPIGSVMYWIEKDEPDG